MKILSYEFDSPELISKIGFLLGSDEWHHQHKQALRRQNGKVFYLLVDDSDLISMCSVHKKQILDCHTMVQYRNRGNMLYLLGQVLEKERSYLYSGTANPAMEKIFLKLGMVYKSNKGQYRYYERNAK